MPPNNDKKLLLEEFIPYRLSYLANVIGRDLAALYVDKFGISPSEWKVMAVLNRFPDISAAEVAAHTAMDKVAVSRAVNALIKQGHIARSYSPEDRRVSILSFTKKGQNTYRKIEPLVLDYEVDLLSKLSPNERKNLDQLLNKFKEMFV